MAADALQRPLRRARSAAIGAGPVPSPPAPALVCAPSGPKVFRHPNDNSPSPTNVQEARVPVPVPDLLRRLTTLLLLALAWALASGPAHA